MYKIGEFSILSKVTIKALRYYEKENLLMPVYIDKETGYRYYDTNQLPEISKIISLRQIGMSIKDIKKILNGHDMKALLEKRKKEIQENILLYNTEFSKINYLLEGKNMNNEIVLKELPSYTVYYKEGTVEDFSKIGEFVIQSAKECLALNPGLKCIEPEYCYVSYLDGQYKDKNIRIRYSEAVEKAGKEDENIKFVRIQPVMAICIYHKGAYDGIRNSYNSLMKYIEDNEYEIIESPRERYIDGCWNKENEEDYLTELQIPIRKR